jgi:hypothetical protein
MRIAIAVPTDPDYYATTDERARRVAQRLLDELLAYAHRTWPAASVTGRLVRETVSQNNRGAVWGDDGEIDDQAEDLIHQATSSLFEQINESEPD